MSFTLWFTGISASGKTTLSQKLYSHLKSRGLKVELLDGDLIRAVFNQDLGFSPEERNIQVRRLGIISHLLNKHDIIAIVGAISPYAAARAKNRQIIDRYVEVFCSCPLEVATSRDPKGLYAKALAGEISNFTGISAPYEPPETPEIIAQTHLETIEESTANILTYLENCGYIPLQEYCRTVKSAEKELRSETTVS